MRWRIGGAAALLSAVLLLGCDSITGTKAKTYDPVWITASFTPPGVNGAPSGRIERVPAEFVGARCPAKSVLIDNWYSNGQSLTIKNNCTDTQVFSICVSKGSDPQELPACATDPVQTSPFDMKVQYLTPGPYGNWYSSTRLVTVHVFYCPLTQTLVGPPLKCK